MALVKKSANGQYGSYADIAAIVRKLDEQGVEIQNPTSWDEHEESRGVSTRYRKKGETEWSEPTAWVKVDPGAPNNRNSVMQQWRSAYTYARRISIELALGLAPADEDDGEAVGQQVEYATIAQQKHIAEVSGILDHKVADSRHILAPEAVLVIEELGKREPKEKVDAAPQNPELPL